MRLKFAILTLNAIFFFGCSGEAEAEEEVYKLERNPKEVVEAEGMKIEVYDFNGFEPFLDQQDDKIHVINFWATWCVPCVAELPAFKELHDKYASQNVEVLLVSLDFPKQIESDLVPFITRENLKPEVIVLDDPDGNTWIPKVDPDWSGAIPATIIYQNEKSNFYERSFNFTELEQEVLKFKTEKNE